MDSEVPSVVVVPSGTPRPIEEVVTQILASLDLSSIDSTPFVNKLKDNLILTERHLLRIPPSDLRQLGLPLLLEVELRRFVTSCTHKSSQSTYISPNFLRLDQYGKSEKHSESESYDQRERSASSGSSSSSDTIPRKHNVSGSPTQVDSAILRSSLFNLTKAERERIRDQWSAISSDPDGKLKVFFATFYEELFKIDSRAKLLWEKASDEMRNKTLFRIASLIVQTLDDPTVALLSLRSTAVKHMIWEVDAKQFQSWAVAFTKAIHVAIAPDTLSVEMKEAWIAIISRLSEIITSTYEKLRVGLSGTFFYKHSSGWKSHKIKLTHEYLVIYSDVDHRRTKDELALRDFQEVVRLEGTDERFGSKPSSYCFCLRSSESERFFAVETEAEIQFWLQELRLRVSAWNYLKELEQSNQDEKAPSNSKTAKHKSIRNSNRLAATIAIGSLSMLSKSHDSDDKKTSRPPVFEDLALDRSLLNEFTKYMEAHNNSEYLMFWKEATKFRRMAMKSAYGTISPRVRIDLKGKAEAIVAKFITGTKDDGKYVLFLSQRSVTAVTKNLAQSHMEPTIFDPAISEAEHVVLRPHFIEFLKSRTT